MGKRKIEEVAEEVVEEPTLTEEEKREKKEKKKAKKEKKRLKKEKKEKERAEIVEEVVEDDAEVKRKHKEAKKSKKDKIEEAPVAKAATTSGAPGELDIKVYPEEEAHKYPPLQSFDELFAIITKNNKKAGVEDGTNILLNTMKTYINNKQFTKPSPIQAFCWPALFQHKDLVGIAQTGSGKTLAFLFPALYRLELMRQKGQNKTTVKPHPKILVVAPTRELAMQSYQVCVDIGLTGSICLYGGMSKHQQVREMSNIHKKERSGLDIVIATPGRLLDIIQDENISLESVFYLVLDEADRMLDEGFEPAIRQIISRCPTYEHRQTVMLSATWPEEIRTLANNYLNTNPGELIRIVVGSEELSANHRVTQIVEVVENNSRVKDQKLIKLLGDYHKSKTNKILIFVLYKAEASKLQQTLEYKGFNVTAIHGNKTQADRTDALESFRNGSVPLLIATDVAARGLDIPNVEYVINYSFPLTVEDYVHRIGRTGRAGKFGVSHTFFTDFDKSLAGGLVGVLQEAKQDVPKEIYQFPLLTKKKESKLYGAFGPKADMSGKTSTKITFD